MSGRPVLLVGARPPPTGGVATHCDELLRALWARGREATLIDPRRRQGDGRPALLWHLGRARRRGALVHLHTNGHNRNSWLLAALCASGRPALLTLHSGLAPAYIAAHRGAVRAVVERYDHVVVVNEAIAAALDEAGLAPSRRSIIAAFTPASLAFRLAPPGLRQLRRTHPVLVACALAPGIEYGATVMLEAFAALRRRLPTAGLLLYGPGTRDLPAQEGVYRLGELDRPRALAVVAAADVFVRPTLADGDAISVREAQALGRRVVASQAGARPPGVLTFPVGDAAACAEQLFRSLAQQLPEGSTAVDCLPPLLALYRHLGVQTEPVATGTALASAE